MPLKDSGWIITHIGQSRGITGTYCHFCISEVIGYVAARHLVKELSERGWVQDPLPSDTASL